MPSVLPIRTSNKQKKLFVFPYAGSDASFIYSYLADIPLDYDVFTIEYPGRKELISLNELPTFNGLCHKIAYLITQSISFSDELFFSGISMGGYIAFKVAHLLETKLMKSAQSLQLYSVISERSLKIALDEQWAEKFLEPYRRQEELQVLYNHIKALMLVDGQILRTMSLGTIYLSNTPLHIFNGSEDSYCLTDEAKNYWQKKSIDDFFYQIIPGAHIPKILQNLQAKPCD